MKRYAWLAGLALALAARAENWPQWRGPRFNGSTPETGLPVEWSKTNNVAWTAPLPGYSGATPAVWGDSVFVSSPDPQRNLLLVGLDRKTGQTRWQKTVAAGDREQGRNNMASPSPVTDGQSVFIFFATGDLAAFDFSGQELWHRQLAKDYGRFNIQWIYGSSPLLYQAKLFVEVIRSRPRRDDSAPAPEGKLAQESFLLCLDPATGTNLWSHIRSTDAQAESQEAYSTPIPSESAGGPEILVVGGNYLTAHAIGTGEELWRCGGLNVRNERSWRIVPSPVIAHGLIFVCGPKRDPLLAVKDGGKGLVTETHIAWQSSEFTSDCVTPLVYLDKLFVLDGDRQTLTCLDPQTGEKRWQGNLGVREIFRASPTGADGRIYCVSENGTVVVVDAGAAFKVLATIPMGEGPVRASIAAAHGQLFIRTASHLYCVGKP